MSNSIRLADLLNDVTTPLGIPNFSGKETSLEAASMYARHGWFVLPVRSGTKNPGSVVGRHWPDQSSRDSGQITAWFANTSHGIALDVGRSGAVAFDVDRPAALPSTLRSALMNSEVPMQTTRLNELERGHYLFATPSRSSFTNSGGGFGSGWGEVRSRNGVIIAFPSVHPSGGQYAWQRVGLLPQLPRLLASQLRAYRHHDNERLDVDSLEFIAKHSNGSPHTLLQARIEESIEMVGRGRSRHDSVRDGLLQAVFDAACGLYPMDFAVSQFADMFHTIKPAAEQSPQEFRSMVTWCVQIAARLSAVEKSCRLTALRLAGKMGTES